MESAVGGADRLGATALAVGADENSGHDPNTVFVFPATLAQRRFWVLDKLAGGGNPALNMALPMRLRGPADHVALRRALNEVVARHEALRTSFVSEHGELRQVISPAVTLDLPLVDVQDRSGKSLSEISDHLMQEEAHRPFDLASGPLVRATLAQLEAQDHLLLLTVHHIISDGWSNEVLMRELCAFYGAFVRDEQPALPELRIQFADYADWQHERLQAGDFSRHLECWQHRLAGDLPVLDLPTDRPRLKGRIVQGDIRSRVLPPELVSAAKSLAAREGGSPFMFYLAIFQVLLHRYTGQIDFLITSPSANRQRQEFESVIGLFANPLLLRADLRDDPSFHELLGRVRAVALEAFENQDVPFELLLDEFQPSQLQVNFLYQSTFAEPATLPDGLSVEPLVCVSVGTVYEVSASVLDEAGGLRLELEYNTALFDPATIDRMLDHYQTLLESVVADATKPISTLPMLTTREKRQLGLEIVTAGSPEMDDSISAASLALRECAELSANERFASCSPPGTATAAEEVGAARGANALLVHPTAGLFSKPAPDLAAWLETENIAVACLPAAAWNRLAAAIATGKVSKPAQLRLVIATEGDCDEGSFGRVSSASTNGAHNSIRVCSRTVVEEAGGTIAINGRILPAARRLRVLDSRSGQPMPVGVPGELFAFNGHAHPVKTGRIAKWLPDGSLVRRGRASEQHYVRGFRLKPRVTETAICALPGVRHAVVRFANVEERAAFIAYILPDSSTDPLPNDRALRQLLRKHGLPDALLPAAFITLKDIPLRAADGALDLAALPSVSDERLIAAPDPVRPYRGLQLQLLALWEEVLGMKGIGIREDFFDLGGNSLLAMRMLHRVELATGKVLLPSALFTHATVEDLAEEIAREAIDDSPSLLPVQESGSRTPIFYLHGDFFGGGCYSLKLSRALGQEQPFYVIPPQDLRTLPAAPSIEEMAAEHLAALRAVRPKGPYVIGGFCVGGLIAYELAQQIKASGDIVEMLLIIDAEPQDKGLRTPRRLATASAALFRWDDKTKVANFGLWVARRTRLANWFELDLRTRLGAFLHWISWRVLKTWNGWRRRLSPPGESSANSATTNAATDSDRDARLDFLWASAGYRPRPYAGPVAVLVSDDVMHTNLLDEWRQFAPEAAIHRLIGSHLECITVHVDKLAGTIETCLQNANAAATSRPQS